ncbi:MAG TPA: cohesin domain-containing protein [Burkholderiales bacterium]|nr:cohesin domain-containing protein [Burkholderiales bacterium]
MSKFYWSLALAAATGVLSWWWSAGAADTQDTQRAHSSLAPSEPRPQADLQPQRRALPSPLRDLFSTPPKPPARKPTPVVEVAQAPMAPPLPYKYDGSGVLQGKSFVYLKRQDRNFLVSAGDTLEGTYAVEAVARDHVVLRYLPLGIRQVMMYQAGAEVPPELAAAPSPSRPVALQVDMPAEVVLGQEFVVIVALPGAGALKATVEVGYDSEVLSMVGAGLPRPSGRAVVEVASGSTPRAQLRFKVLADTPASTDIALKVNATDASGKRVPVWTPTAYTVSLVLPGGA